MRVSAVCSAPPASLLALVGVCYLLGIATWRDLVDARGLAGRRRGAARRASSPRWSCSLASWCVPRLPAWRRAPRGGRARRARLGDPAGDPGARPVRRPRRTTQPARPPVRRAVAGASRRVVVVGVVVAAVLGAARRTGGGPMARVLVVDDDHTVREVVVSYLRAGRPRRARGRRRRDGAASRCATDPADLVVLDLMLPGIDGLEVCRRLREQQRRAGHHADRARRRDRPGRRPRAGRRRLRDQAVQPARAGAAGRLGAAPGGRAGRADAAARCDDGDLVVDPAAHVATLRRRAAGADRPRVRPAALPARPPGHGVHPRRAAERGVGLVVRRPVDGHRARAPAAREGRGRPDPPDAAGDGVGRRLPVGAAA